jgi:hypothetical protein
MFVIVLVITIGTVGFGAGFQGRINQQKRVSDEARKLSDMVTRDVQAASGSIFVGQGTDTYTFKSGVAEFACIESCILKNDRVSANDLSGSGLNQAANALVIAGKDSYKIYFSEGNKDKTAAIYYNEIKRTDVAKNTLYSIDIMSVRNDNNLISSSKADTTISFGGLCASDKISTRQQSYVQYYILSQTKDYIDVNVQNRARAEIRSTVTSRSY